MSLIVKAGKACKKFIKEKILGQDGSHPGRFERITTDKRVCAMTFDDGPCDIPANPDLFGGRSLTDVILDTLGKYGAKGTFDVVGDTSENYPDKAGAKGSASWGGIKYDHYPDINRDDKGGAVHNDRLIRRMIDEGHQITSHGYRHIIFGPKPFVYGKRAHFNSMDEVLADLRRLDSYMQERYGYKITMHRPPHYVDKIPGGHSSHEVCEIMGYTYLGASFDGGGWLPSSQSDEKAAFDAEVEAMVFPVRKALEENPDFFCGQIIFQKDGCNMAGRTPVAVALDKQLEILTSYGYKIVTAEELLKEGQIESL